MGSILKWVLIFGLIGIWALLIYYAGSIAYIMIIASLIPLIAPFITLGTIKIVKKISEISEKIQIKLEKKLGEIPALIIMMILPLITLSLILSGIRNFIKQEDPTTLEGAINKVAEIMNYSYCYKTNDSMPDWVYFALDCEAAGIKHCLILNCKKGNEIHKVAVHIWEVDLILEKQYTIWRVLDLNLTKPTHVRRNNSQITMVSLDIKDGGSCAYC